MKQGYKVIRPPSEIFIKNSNISLEKKKPNRGVKVKILDSSRGNNGVELPIEGGILTYYIGEKYPFKGFQFPESARAIISIKGIIRIFLSVKYLIPLFWFNEKFLIKLSELFLKETINCRLIPFRYCKSGNTIYWIGMRFVKKQFQEYLLKSFCLVWEYDDAYRYEGQDVLGETKLEALRKNPAKEIVRLFDLFIERQVHQEKKKEWGKTRLFLSLLLPIFNIKLKKIAKRILQQDIDNIKLDKGDIYHCLIRDYYNFQGKSFSQRFAERRKIDEKI